jgi:hypothetical protein
MDRIINIDAETHDLKMDEIKEEDENNTQKQSRTSQYTDHLKKLNENRVRNTESEEDNQDNKYYEAAAMPAEVYQQSDLPPMQEEQMFAINNPAEEYVRRAPKTAGGGFRHRKHHGK